MKKIKLLFILLIFVTNILSAQKKEKQTITDVSFKGTEIILNKKHAFNYQKDGNHFSILTLDDQKIIEGDISSLGDGKFSSLITFLPDRKFSNEKIIGRNQLIFALVEKNVFNKDFSINGENLDEFFKEYNQLK